MNHLEKMKNLGKMFAAEWSIVQNCANILTVDEMLERNRKCFISGETPGFVPLTIFSTHQECNEFLEALKRRRRELHGTQ